MWSEKGRYGVVSIALRILETIGSLQCLSEALQQLLLLLQSTSVEWPVGGSRKMTFLRQVSSAPGGVCGESYTCFGICSVSHLFLDICVPVILGGVTGSDEMVAGMVR